MKRQLAFLIARAQIPLEWLHPASSDDNADGDADVDFQDKLPEDLLDCLSNSRLSMHFRELGKELGVADAKSLEDVYKSHLENTSMASTSVLRDCEPDYHFKGAGTTSNVDSARGNLAGTFVNAFVNAGFGNDKLMVEAEEGNSWIYKNKDHGSSHGVSSRHRIYMPSRNDERGSISWVKFAVGYGRRFKSCGQVYIFGRGTHQGHIS